MKKPMKHAGKGKTERPQGKIKGSGINKKMDKASIPQVVAENKYGRQSQTSKS